jgi:hypothetical protein
MTTQEFVYNTKEHLNKYIKQADQKASILLTAQLAFLGLFANALNTLSIPNQVWVQNFAYASGAVGLIAVFLAGWTVYPRTPEQETGFILWDNIREYGSESDFRSAIYELDDDDIVDEVIDENYKLAKVAKDKYFFLKVSLIATAAMVVFAVVAGVLFLLST